MDSNLDHICFKHGIEIPCKTLIPPSPEPEKCGNIIQKALGILQEDGLFAFYIYLLSIEGNSDEGIASLRIQGKIDQLFRNENVELLKEISSPEKAEELRSEELNEFLQSKSLIEEKETIFRRLEQGNIERSEKEKVNEKKNKINSFITKEIISLTEDINTLLLAKSLIEKTLIYARYQAKSLSD